MSTYKVPSASLSRLMGVPHRMESAQLEMVTDNLLQVVFYVDTSFSRMDNAVWEVAALVDELAVFLDQFDNMTFAAFDIGFYAAREMHRARPKHKRIKPYLKR